ncbi:hypothetical protein [Arthrobacter sp. TMS1-12-1]
MTLLMILLVLLALTGLLVRHLARVIDADAPTVTPSSHADWSAGVLPSSAYALRHDTQASFGFSARGWRPGP